jgi:hypothetical protein
MKLITISISIVLILLITEINTRSSMFSASASKAKAKMSTRNNLWVWKPTRGFLKDVSVNSFNEFAAVSGRGVLWGIDQMTNRWRRYPGAKTGITAVAFSNENVVWICRGNVIEKFIPFHSKKFYGRWVRIPGCCRDIDIGADNFVAVIGCDNHQWGMGIWRNLGGDNRRWARIAGQADNIAVGARGQIVVKNRGRRFFWKYRWNSNWIMTPGAGYDVALSGNGRMLAIGLDHHVYWSRTIGPKPTWVKNNGMGFRITARKWRNPTVVGMDHALWTAK